MATRWSFNVDGLDVDDSVWNLLIADAKTNPPTYVTIMDSKDKAKQWQREIPSCQVIYRTYDKSDNYYHHTVTPQQAAQRLESDHADMRDMWHYYRLNEAGGEWNKYQDWIIRFAQEAKARGFKVTAGGLALGKNWRTPDDIANGQADAFLDYAIVNEDTFLFDFHEYVTGTLWSPQIPSYPAALFDRDLILANENIPVSVDNYNGLNDFTNWGLFRFAWLANARALERHGKRLNGVLNEGLNDFNSHIIQDPHIWSKLPNGQTVKTEDEIRKYAEVRYNRDVRGVLGHWLYLSWVATGKMAKLPEPEYCDFIIRNFKWAEKSYPENVKGIMLFAINKDWELPEGHDFSPIIRTLLPKMHVLSLGTPIPPPDPDPLPEDPPLPELKPIRMQGWSESEGKPYRVRVRAEATTASAELGWLPAAPQITEGWISIAEPTPADGWIWSYVEFGTLKGWLSMSFVRRDDDIPLPAPVEDPRVPILLALVKTLLSALKAVRQRRVDDVADDASEILYIDEVIGQAENDAA